MIDVLWQVAAAGGMLDDAEREMKRMHGVMTGDGLAHACDGSDEQHILRQAREGSRDAFTEVVLLYQKKVFRLAYGFFNDREEAMEVVQDTFMKIYQHLGKFREGTRFSSWLYRIATNLCIDRYRKTKGDRQREMDWHRLKTAASGEPPDPEACLQNHMDLCAVRRSLGGLSPRQRAIFVMKHGNHFKYREIAEILNLSVGTIKSLHHRAIQKMRNHQRRGKP